jgi:hypothetical protein
MGACLELAAGEERYCTSGVQTLLGSQPKKMTLEMKFELGGILRGSLSELPPDKQISELRFDWDLVGSPSLLPTLQQLAKQPLKDPGSNVSTIYTTRERLWCK